MAANVFIVQLNASQHGCHIVQQREKHRSFGTGLLVPTHNADTAHTPGRDRKDRVGPQNLHAGAQSQLDVAANAGGDTRRNLVLISCQFINDIHGSSPLLQIPMSFRFSQIVG